jgi:hypothetical protein
MWSMVAHRARGLPSPSRFTDSIFSLHQKHRFFCALMSFRLRLTRLAPFIRPYLMGVGGLEDIIMLNGGLVG